MGNNRPAKRTEDYPLTDKEKVFSLLYIANKFNATAAFAEMNPTHKDPKRASKRLIDYPNVKKHIKNLIESKLKDYSIRAADVLKEMSHIAYSDIRDFMDFALDEVTLKSSSQMGDEAKAIKKITTTPVYHQGEHLGNKIQIELYDKLQALRLIGLNIGMFKETFEIKVDDIQQQASDEGYNNRMKKLLAKAADGTPKADS